MSVALWLSPVLVPVLCAAMLALRPGPRTSWLLVAAPMPAAVLAAVGDAVAAPRLDWLLLGVELAVDDLARLLLLLASLVWAAAGAYARAEAQAHRPYAALWLLALAGNVGLLVAADVVTFYTAFVVMTFAAYGLVVHNRTGAARRAGRIYVVLAVVGETALLGALLLAVTEAPSLRMDDVAAAVAGSPHRDLLVALLFVGFGIKAGVIGLHMWLPLAHPAAPFPASAVLSGTMIKAGLVGWVRLLPVGEVALPGWSDIVIALGVLTAFAGVLLGLSQRDPKVVLAYSSVSQMGFITVLVGVALRLPDVAPVAIAGAAVYALHHGLAKAALFLGVGIVGAASRTARRVLLLGMVLAAASLAGLPATSGAFAKAWLKESLDLAAVGGGVGLALSLAAAGTTVLMVRLLLLLPGLATATGAVAIGPWLALLGAVLVATAAFPARVLALDVPVGVGGPIGWDTIWPVVLGLGLALAARPATRRHRALVRQVPAVPAGDVVVAGERAVLLAGHGLAASAQMARRAGRAVAAAAQTPARWSCDRRALLDRFEAWTTRRRTGGAIAALVAVALLLTLTLPGP